MEGFLRKLFSSGRSPERKQIKAFPRRQSFILESIESRLLLSADLIGVPTELPASSSVVSQFVHEQLVAPDHGGIGAEVSAFAQTQHSPNQNGDPQGSVVSQFVHQQLAAPDHGGIGAEVSAFAQAQHSAADQAGDTSQTTANLAASEVQNGDRQASAWS